MFVPDAGQGMWLEDEITLDTPEDQAYIIKNHLTVLLRMISDARMRGIASPAFVTAVEDVLRRVETYVRTQKDFARGATQGHIDLLQRIGVLQQRAADLTTPPAAAHDQALDALAADIRSVILE